MIIRLSGCLLLLCLAACAQLPPMLSGNDETRQVSDLIAYGQKTGRLAPAEQRRELTGAAEAFARDRDPVARLRLALLLASPGSAINDDNRAAALLEPFAAPAALAEAGPLIRLGALLQAQVNERIREQKRAQQLREQIDALRAVDRTLMERGQSRNQ